MKKQINPSIKAHLLWSALVVLSLLAICAIPLALTQSNVVLYDQLNNPTSGATNSQEFPDSPTLTDFAADDFVVPSGQTWTITEVDAQGTYSGGGGPADNFNVFFYQNNGSLPGTQVYSATAQSYVINGGVFQVTLTVPAVLTAGTYWVSVQAHMSSTNGQWFGSTGRCSRILSRPGRIQAVALVSVLRGVLGPFALATR